MKRSKFLKIAAITIIGIQTKACTLFDKPKSDDELLWEIYSFTGSHWNNAAFSKLTKKAFDNTIKTLGHEKENKELIDIYSSNIKAGKDKDQVLKDLYFGTLLKPEVKSKTTDIFIKLNTIHGGFKVLGLKNYKGYVGGSFNQPKDKLPYRTS